MMKKTLLEIKFEVNIKNVKQNKVEEELDKPNWDAVLLYRVTLKCEMYRKKNSGRDLRKQTANS